MARWPSHVALEWACAGADRRESLVIGTSHVHPGGVSPLSPLADALIARAATPVVVVADALPPCAEGPVVVGISANAPAQGVLSYAFRHAHEHGAEIRAVTCWQRRRGARGPAVLGNRHLAELWLFDTRPRRESSLRNDVKGAGSTWIRTV